MRGDGHLLVVRGLLHDLEGVLNPGGDHGVLDQSIGRDDMDGLFADSLKIDARRFTSTNSSLHSPRFFFSDVAMD